MVKIAEKWEEPVWQSCVMLRLRPRNNCISETKNKVFLIYDAYSIKKVETSYRDVHVKGCISNPTRGVITRR